MLSFHFSPSPGVGLSVTNSPGTVSACDHLQANTFSRVEASEEC